MLIDTHAHLDEQAFDPDRAETVQRAADAGVESILTIGITLRTSQAAVALANEYPSVFAVVGIQPNYAAEASPMDWAEIETLARQPKVVAIGETGLDRYWDFAPLDIQADFFTRHVQLAQELELPFVVHCRDAEADVVSQLRTLGGPFRGVMHSFCGSTQTARECLDLGLHISFSGMLTYRKNQELRETAALIPRDRLLVETDAPYLVPHKQRKAKVKRNEPSFVVETGACLAEAQGLSFEEMATICTANAKRLFGLD
ncbi:MAG: TatD family hydrolase [Planctomycetota bacterium]|nr:TatD family hydrolase [Planctomycetota bacterium]